MKKTYMTPEIQTVELEIKQLIMTSGAGQSGLTGTTNEEWDSEHPVDW